MDENLRDQIRNNFEILETAALQEIWDRHDTHEYTEETFTLLRQVLIKRLGSDPGESTRGLLNRIYARIDALRTKKAFSAAMDECLRAQEIAPSDPSVHYYRGLIHEDLREPEQALVCYQKAVELDPELGDAERKLRLLENQQEKEFQRSGVKACLDRAIMHAEDEEFVRAEREIETAERDMPRLPGAQIAYGSALLAVERYDDAVQVFELAVRLNPRHSTARRHLRDARVLREEARYLDEAEGREETDSVDQSAVETFDTDAFESNQDRIEETPGWVYMDSQAHMVKGTSGYRTRPGRSGLDPLDTRFEEARMEGSLLRRLFTGNLRTHDPLYLIMMTILGIIFSLPLVFVLGVSANESEGALLLLCPFGMIGISGISLLINVVISLLSEKPKDVEENGGIFF